MITRWREIQSCAGGVAELAWKAGTICARLKDQPSAALVADALAEISVVKMELIKLREPLERMEAAAMRQRMIDGRILNEGGGE